MNATLPASAAFQPGPSPWFQQQAGSSAFSPYTAPALNQPQAQVPSVPPPQLLSVSQSSLGNPLWHFRLANGHQVVIEKRDTDAISLRTFIRAGSINEKPVYETPLYSKDGMKPGGAHLDEHVHFLSTEHYPGRNQWARAVEQYGAYLNASTDYETIQHELLFNKQDLSDILKLHAEALLHPAYDPSLIFQEKRNVINEASERMADPESVAYSKLLEMLFERPHFQSLGNRSDVQNTTAQDLRDFFNKFYTPRNMVTVISGDITPQEVLPQLNQTFGRNASALNRQKPDERRNTLNLRLALKPNEIRSISYFDPSLPSSRAYVAFPAPPLSDDRTEALQQQGLLPRTYTQPQQIPPVQRDRMAMLLLQKLLTGGLNSLLPTMLTDRLQEAQSISFDYEAYRRTGMAVMALETQPGQEEKAVERSLHLLGQLGQRPIAPSLLAQTKKRLQQDFRQSQETTDATTELLGNEALYTGLSFYTNFDTILDAITPQDLQRVARQYLTPNRYALVYAKPGEQKGFSPKWSNQTGVMPLFLPEGQQMRPYPGQQQVEQVYRAVQPEASPTKQPGGWA